MTSVESHSVKLHFTNDAYLYTYDYLYWSYYIYNHYFLSNFPIYKWTYENIYIPIYSFS